MYFLSSPCYCAAAEPVGRVAPSIQTVDCVIQASFMFIANATTVPASPVAVAPVLAVLDLRAAVVVPLHRRRLRGPVAWQIVPVVASAKPHFHRAPII